MDFGGNSNVTFNIKNIEVMIFVPEILRHLNITRKVFTEYSLQCRSILPRINKINISLILKFLVMSLITRHFNHAGWNLLLAIEKRQRRHFHTARAVYAP